MQSGDDMKTSLLLAVCSLMILVVGGNAQSGSSQTLMVTVSNVEWEGPQGCRWRLTVVNHSDDNAFLPFYGDYGVISYFLERRDEKRDWVRMGEDVLSLPMPNAKRLQPGETYATNVPCSKTYADSAGRVVSLQGTFRMRLVYFRGEQMWAAFKQWQQAHRRSGSQKVADDHLPERAHAFSQAFRLRPPTR